MSYDQRVDCWHIACYTGYGSRVKLGEKEFGRYPENLLNSRVRYSRAFQVRLAAAKHDAD